MDNDGYLFNFIKTKSVTWIILFSAIPLSELSSKVVQVIETEYKSRSFWVISDVTGHPRVLDHSVPFSLDQ